MAQKERIVKQSRRMFIGQGIKSVRMDDIARALSVSKRTLYELFGDKEGLLYLALIDYFEEERRHWESRCSAAQNVLEALFMTLSDVMDHAEATQRLMENCRKFYPAVYDRLMREEGGRRREELREMLVQGTAEGLFIDSIDNDLAMAVLYHTASTLVSRRDLLLPEGMDERRAFLQIISTFFRGIATTKGLELIDSYLSHYELELVRGA